MLGKLLPQEEAHSFLSCRVWRYRQSVCVSWHDVATDGLNFSCMHIWWVLISLFSEAIYIQRLHAHPGGCCVLTLPRRRDLHIFLSTFRRCLSRRISKTRDDFPSDLLESKVFFFFCLFCDATFDVEVNLWAFREFVTGSQMHQK